MFLFEQCARGLSQTRSFDARLKDILLASETSCVMCFGYANHVRQNRLILIDYLDRAVQIGELEIGFLDVALNLERNSLNRGDCCIYFALDDLSAKSRLPSFFNDPRPTDHFHGHVIP